MSLPQQRYYYNTPYPPPIMVPSIQYPQIPSPTSSQYTSESSPSPTEYPYGNLQIPEPVPSSSTGCATAQVYQNPNQIQIQQHHRHLHHNHHTVCQHHQQQQRHQLDHHTNTQHPPLTYPTVVLDPAPAPRPPPKSRPTKSSTVVASSKKTTQIAHPYARLYAKKDETKRRKIWNHALEKSIFTPYELSTLGAPQRRAIYIASLEAHIDSLHERLLSMGFWPVGFEDLDQFKGLNSKTAKSMVSGLQHDASMCKLKLMELERANEDLQKILLSLPQL